MSDVNVMIVGVGGQGVILASDAMAEICLLYTSDAADE